MAAGYGIPRRFERVCLLYFQQGTGLIRSICDQLRKRNLALFKRKESILGIDISSSSIKLIELSRLAAVPVEGIASNRWARG